MSYFKSKLHYGKTILWQYSFCFSKFDFCPFTLFSLFFFFILKQKVKEDLLKTKQTNKKTAFKQRPGSKGFTWKISNTQRRTDTDPSQTLPNRWRVGVTPKIISWIYYHSDTKTRQRHNNNNNNNNNKL